jgi:hypothetical protein
MKYAVKYSSFALTVHGGKTLNTGLLMKCEEKSASVLSVVFFVQIIS